METVCLEGRVCKGFLMVAQCRMVNSTLLTHGEIQVTLLTHQQVEHDLLTRSAIAFIQAVGGADEPRNAMSGNLHQLHEGPRTSP